MTKEIKLPEMYEWMHRVSSDMQYDIAIHAIQAVEADRAERQREAVRECEDSQAGQCWKCGDADPDFQGKCEAQPAPSLEPDRLHIAAIDLARKQSGALIELETMNANLREQNTAIDEACAKLEAANSELLRSLEEMKMWISIAVELACLDPKTTEVEFEFENGSPPKTISIYSSMQLANAAIEKNKSKS